MASLKNWSFVKKAKWRLGYSSVGSVLVERAQSPGFESHKPGMVYTCNPVAQETVAMG